MGWTTAAATAARAGTVVTALLLAACASATVETTVEHRGGLGCVDDSRHCIDERQAALRALMSDRERRWVRQPSSPQAYASGVRLFAFKGRKKELSCEELMIGKREADAGPAVLRGAGSSHLTPAQISRGTMLAGEVGRELGHEMKRRCRTAETHAELSQAG